MSSNTTGISEHVIHFPIKQHEACTATVEYLPFGTKSLKIRSYIPPGASDQSVLILRPSNCDPRKQVFAGHEDNVEPGDADLLVTWGAGHEQGTYARSKDSPVDDKGQPLSQGEDGYCYFNVTHRPKLKNSMSTLQVKSYRLTICARQTMGGRLGSAISDLIIKLEPPQGIQDPVHANWNEASIDESIVNFKGALVPIYLSRWWPTERVSYIPLSGERPKLDQLTIRYQRAVSRGKGRISVISENKILAVIEGDIGERLFDDRLFSAEVFVFNGPEAFDRPYFLLRLWFMWIRKLKKVNEEVPDVERFDLLIEGAANELRYVGTDAHWTEKWGRPIGEGPWLGKIGLSSDKNPIRRFSQWLEQGISFIWDKLRSKVSGDPVNYLYEDLRWPPRRERQTSLLGLPVLSRLIKAPGPIDGKHNPNGDVEILFQSNDVRRG